MADICDNCKWKGTVENSMHSCCNHPEARAMMSNGDEMRHIMEGLVKENRVRPLIGLRVDAEEDGVRGNWCLWPWNFDPLWITYCSGKEELL